VSTDLAAHFRHAANQQFSGIGATASPLYAALAHGVADDPDMLDLAGHAAAGQPVSNLLFSSIYFLLLRGEAHPAGAYFYGVVDAPLPPHGAFPHVRDFCLAHRAELIAMLRTRRVQTNEVQRSALWVPAFASLAISAPDTATATIAIDTAKSNNAQFAMIEIGASAGLNLHWDRHGYRYNDHRVGDPNAALQLACTASGDPPLPTTLPDVCYRLGVDLDPIDVFDNDAVAWLRALIWPEQRHRVDALKQAVAVARQHPVEIRGGDAADLVPAALAEVPSDLTLCLCHSFTWNQCPPTVRERIEAALRAASHARVIHRLSIEWLDDRPKLERFTYRDGDVEHALLAYVDSHGRRIEWC
jgi:hypothetical protein